MCVCGCVYVWVISEEKYLFLLSLFVCSAIAPHVLLRASPLRLPAARQPAAPKPAVVQPHSSREIAEEEVIETCGTAFFWKVVDKLLQTPSLGISMGM